MFVKDYMTADPRTISPDLSISDALSIMEQNDFHRLPVVDSNGVLIGLITEGLISESSGRDKTSLSMFELNYLLSRTKVHEIMIKDVKTIQGDSLLETAAEMMTANKINVLPVIDDAKHVVGIITERDIFKAFMDLLGYNRTGMRYVVEVKDIPGEMEMISALFTKENKNIESLAVYHNSRGVELVILAEEASAGMEKKLEEAGWKVTNITHRSGK